MESITLTVRPEAMSAKASELSAEKAAVANIMEEAKAKITALAGTWRSSAADEYQSRFRQVYDDIDNVLAIVSEYINDLTEAASIYANAERAATDAAQGLPTDGVFRN